MLQNRLAQLREKRADSDNGFTLIELLVVVVIIGVLIAIAIPLYLNYTKSSKDTSAQSDLRGAVSTLEQCNADNGSYPSAVGSTGTMTGCSTQQIKLSNNTTVAYFPGASNSSYLIESVNSGGNKSVWCYASQAGGSVAKIPGRTTVDSTAPASLAACPTS